MEEIGNSMSKYIKVMITVFVLLTLYLMFLHPMLKPWYASLDGKAELAQAEQNRQIRIIEAEAANIAATSNAEAQIKVAVAQATAEVERAKGVAQANQIIASGLKDNEPYLRYLWIQSLNGNQVIYIPTEANLPILEAKG